MNKDLGINDSGDSLIRMLNFSNFPTIGKLNVGLNVKCMLMDSYCSSGLNELRAIAGRTQIHPAAILL